MVVRWTTIGSAIPTATTPRPSTQFQYYTRPPRISASNDRACRGMGKGTCEDTDAGTERRRQMGAHDLVFSAAR
ncbi:hypothetical protein B0H10DRAFT_2230898 [Mycena sp. CBHHK59/15]|nr:hypothetical protein B0H10DRAFT_2230898 [Mycena sp. CBHHK59/15]